MKKIYWGRLYKEQEKIEEAYDMFENVLFSEYHTLNFAFSFMTGMALEENDIENASFLAEKTGALSGVFDMGKYNECSAMLDVVCAEKNVQGTYRVVEQLLQNVDSLCDFQKSKLFQHMKFKNLDSSFTEGIKEKLLNGFRDEGAFGYMKGFEAWERLINI